jgi:hypothetical protein
MRMHERLKIESAVTVGMNVMSEGGGIEFGRLHDIAEEGARFYIERPLAESTPVNLLVHFRGVNGRVVTLGFDAVVIRAGTHSPYEVAVRFESDPHFIRGDLSELLKYREKRSGHGPGDDPPRRKEARKIAGNSLVNKHSVH